MGVYIARTCFPDGLPDHAGQRVVSVQNHVTVDKGQNNQSAPSSIYRVLVQIYQKLILRQCFVMIFLQFPPLNDGASYLFV